MPDYTCELNICTSEGRIKDELSFRSYIRNRYDYLPITMYMIVRIGYDGMNWIFTTLEAVNRHLREQKHLKNVRCEIILMVYAKGHELVRSKSSSFEFDSDCGVIYSMDESIRPRVYTSIKSFFTKKRRCQALLFRVMNMINKQFVVKRFNDEPNVRVRGVVYDDIQERTIQMDKPNQYTLWAGHWRSVDWEFSHQNQLLRERHQICYPMWYSLRVGTNKLLWNKRVKAGRNRIMNMKIKEYFGVEFTSQKNNDMRKQEVNFWNDKMLEWFEIKFSYDNKIN